MAEAEKSELERLWQENAQLRMDDEFLGKSRSFLRLQAAESECFELMVAEKANYPVQRMARLLRVSRSGSYAWRHRVQSEASARAAQRAEPDTKAREAHTDSYGTYGAPRIHTALGRKGTGVDRKTVASSMRRQGLEGISPRRFRPITPIGDTRVHSIPDLLARRWDTGALDAVWISDITYLRTDEGWVYLCAVRDA